ncbi:NAD(P)-binding protein [Polyplosphaeria fusca]|uniref:NAD(P)-binding protein n=1 Tax=Polyplosphaeria fusca TaxID=682080 RepID=A0A9P4QQV6_9PLEO|nr:NAD(P)-binding protein [Polyplosphaeria fusca]
MSSPKIVIVTGANSGIGWEAVKALLESSRAYTILAAARSKDKATSAIEQLKKAVPSSKSTVEPLVVDLASDESIEKAFEQVKQKYGVVDCLMNNAGAASHMHELGVRGAFNENYNVNVAGTNVMTHTFIPLLLKSSDPRLIFVGGLSQITQAAEEYFPTPPLPAGWPKEVAFETIPYRCSKVALNMLMLDYNHKLKADGVKVWSVSPGFLVTNLGGGGEVAEMTKAMGAGHASEGGDMLRRVVEGERDADTGKFVAKDGGFIPW